MKKIIALFLTLMMFISMVACNNKTSENPSSETYQNENVSNTVSETDTSKNSSDVTSDTNDAGDLSNSASSEISSDDITSKVSSTNSSVEDHTHTIVTDNAVKPTCQTTGLTEGSHCSECKQIITAQKEVPKTAHSYVSTFTSENHTFTCSVCKLKTTESHTLTSNGKSCSVCSFKKETPPSFSKGYYSSEKTYIETDYILYEIDPNIYIIGDLVERTNELCKAIEDVTGLKFNLSQYGGKKILVYVYREGIPRKDSEMSAGAAFAESGPSESSRGDECMHIIRLTSPCALFTGKTSTIIHELAHALRYCQTSTHFTTLIEEGFAEITNYKTMLYLENKKSTTAFLLGSTIGKSGSFEIFDFNYDSKKLLYWLSLTAENFEGNQYALGFYLMSYLDNKYGNFNAWLKNCPDNNGLLSGEAQLQLLKKAYGDSFANDFYSWTKANLKKGEGTSHFYNPYSQNTQDLTGYAPLNFYPDFSNYGRFQCSFAEYSFKYKDLYINLDETKHFLKDYKGRNIDNLYLTLSDDVTVQYFDKNGTMLMESKEKLIDIANVSYIKLVGSGYIGQLQLLGYYDKDMDYTDGEVIFTGTVDDASDGRNEFLTTADASEAMEFAWDTELSYSKAYTLILKLSDSCCDITIVDRIWKESTISGKNEIVISDLRYFAIYNPTNKPVTAKIIVKKTKR